MALRLLWGRETEHVKKVMQNEELCADLFRRILSEGDTDAVAGQGDTKEWHKLRDAGYGGGQWCLRSPDARCVHLLSLGGDKIGRLVILR